MTERILPGGTDPPEQELHVYRECRCIGCGAYHDEEAIDATGRCGTCQQIETRRRAAAEQAETERRRRLQWRLYFERRRADREYRRQLRLARRRAAYRRRRDRERAALGLPPLPIRARSTRTKPDPVS